MRNKKLPYKELIPNLHREYLRNPRRKVCNESASSNCVKLIDQLSILGCDV